MIIRVAPRGSATLYVYSDMRFRRTAAKEIDEWAAKYGLVRIYKPKIFRARILKPGAETEVIAVFFGVCSKKDSKLNRI